MCCWAVATAFPGVCLQNNEAWRNWDEFFMILDDRAEDIGRDLFLILPVFTNRMELGILGCEVPPDWNSTSGGVWRAECGKFVWGVWKSEFSKSVRGGNRSPRDLGLCWGRCWDNRDRFFHGKGKGAVPGAAGKKKISPCSHVDFLGIARRAKPAEGSMQNMHSWNSRSTLPMDTGNGRNLLDQSPGRAAGNHHPPKKNPKSPAVLEGIPWSWKCSVVCGVGMERVKKEPGLKSSLGEGKSSFTGKKILW